MAYFGTYAYFDKITPFLTHPPQNQKDGLKVACYFAENALKKGHPPPKLTIIIMNQQNFSDKKCRINICDSAIFEDLKVALLLCQKCPRTMTPTPEHFSKIRFSRKFVGNHALNLAGKLKIAEKFEN